MIDWLIDWLIWWKVVNLSLLNHCNHHCLSSFPQRDVFASSLPKEIDYDCFFYFVHILLTIALLCTYHCSDLRCNEVKKKKKRKKKNGIYTTLLLTAPSWKLFKTSFFAPVCHIPFTSPLSLWMLHENEIQNTSPPPQNIVHLPLFW